MSVLAFPKASRSGFTCVRGRCKEVHGMWGGRVGEEGGWGGRVHGMVHDTKQLKVVMCQLAYVNKMVDIGLSLTCRILCSNTDLT